MSNVCAGIGRGQLLYLDLDQHRALKESIYRRYEAGVKGLPVTLNPYLEESQPNFWLSCVLIDKESKVTPLEILARLKEEGIESRPIWKGSQCICSQYLRCMITYM